ncbi:MAG TPA: ferritin-like domain-containing protein [Gemmatimonadales bacterium]|nr:ferritin-like domain-containing protein [Gemmatimonadales bacterium]
MQMESLKDLLAEELKDLYNAENQILKALPKMIKKANHQELKSAFQEHLTVTEHQVERLEQVAKQVGVALRGKTCQGMKGIIEEGKEWMDEDAEPATMDAGLIAAAQKVEHYEIAGYGCARTYAQTLGFHEAARLLEETLVEEEQTDRRLTQIAEGLINLEAAEEEVEVGGSMRGAGRGVGRRGRGG